MGTMGSISPPVLSLDLKPTFIPKTITVFLREISMIGNASERSSKLDEFLKMLEEEMNKIDAFKRELPLCMLLLNDAILTLKAETIHCTASSDVHPVLEEFIPLNGNSDVTAGLKKEKDAKDNKMNWMSSVQLWTSNDLPKINTSEEEKKKSVEIAGEEEISATVNTFPYKNGGGALMSFKGFTGFPLPVMKTIKEDKEAQPLTPALSLSTPGGVKITNTELSSGILNSRSSGGSRNHPSVSATNSHSNLQTGTQSPQQPPRKQRRCWSPDLHRRFISALEQLGGSQVATPKQIRELMKVDGLTNDEVKSHLQKFRLHTRRLPNGPSTTANQQGVVLGGLWVPSQDQFGTSKSSNSQSGSPQGPLQLAGAGGGISTTGGESLEDEEDGKSENYCWKGHLHIAGESAA